MTTTLTAEQIDDIADRAATKAVEAYMIKMGIETDEPRDMQQDMIFIRKFRNTCEQAGSKIVMVVIGVLTMGVIGGIVLAVRKSLGL